MEAHALTQLEREGVAGVRNDIAFRDSGDQISFGIGLYKALKHIEKDFSGSCRRHFVGVKTVIQILRDADRQLALRFRLPRRSGRVRRLACHRLAASATAECRSQQSRAEQQSEDPCQNFHG